MAAKGCRTPSATDKPTLKNRVGETAADEQPFGAIGFEPPKLFISGFPPFYFKTQLDRVTHSRTGASQDPRSSPHSSPLRSGRVVERRVPGHVAGLRRRSADALQQRGHSRRLARLVEPAQRVADDVGDTGDMLCHNR